MTQQQLLDYLQASGIPYQFYAHVPVFTCEQATSVAHLNMAGAGVKNLFLKDDRENVYLVSATHHTRINLKQLGKVLNSKNLRFAEPALLMHYLHIEPGSVTPLALINDAECKVQVILDAELFKHEYIQVHPLKNDATVVITPADLVKFLTLLKRSYLVHDFGLPSEVVESPEKSL